MMTSISISYNFYLECCLVKLRIFEIFAYIKIKMNHSVYVCVLQKEFFVMNKYYSTEIQRKIKNGY